MAGSNDTHVGADSPSTTRQNFAAATDFNAEHIVRALPACGAEIMARWVQTGLWCRLNSKATLRFAPYLLFRLRPISEGDGWVLVQLPEPAEIKPVIGMGQRAGNTAIDELKSAGVLRESVALKARRYFILSGPDVRTPSIEQLDLPHADYAPAPVRASADETVCAPAPLRASAEKTACAPARLRASADMSDSPHIENAPARIRFDDRNEETIDESIEGAGTGVPPAPSIENEGDLPEPRELLGQFLEQHQVDALLKLPHVDAKCVWSVCETARLRGAEVRNPAAFVHAGVKNFDRFLPHPSLVPESPTKPNPPVTRSGGLQTVATAAPRAAKKSKRRKTAEELAEEEAAWQRQLDRQATQRAIDTAERSKLSAAAEADRLAIAGFTDDEVAAAKAQYLQANPALAPANQNADPRRHRAILPHVCNLLTGASAMLSLPDDGTPRKRAPPADGG